MKVLTKYILTAAVCMVGALTAYAAQSVMKDAELEIKAAPGVILVRNTHQVQIKVFTILGRMVSSETLPPGTSRLQLPTHGVYIVKVGDLTCKVAV